MNNNVVVDASVLIAVVTNEPHKEKLVQVTQSVDLIAPSSIHWEIGNAFSAMLKRNRIDLVEANEAINFYRQIPVRMVDVELDEAIELASTLSIYAYDAYIIRCALKYKSPLLSLDKGLIYAAKKARVEIIEV